VTFVDRDGERIVCRAPIGQNLLEVAHASNVDLEARREDARVPRALRSSRAAPRVAGRVRGVAGVQHLPRHRGGSVVLRAPEGTRRHAAAAPPCCARCAVLALTAAADAACGAAQEPSDDENDMLDLAFGLTQTSRLGCQVVASKELDGLVVRLPSVRAAGGGAARRRERLA
jgi:ferredoxin